MPLFFFVEPRDTFDRHVVGLRRTGGKDNILRVCPNDVRDVLRWMSAFRTPRKNSMSHLSSLLNGFLGLPTIRMRPAVRVPILVCQEGKHSVQGSRVNGGRRLPGV